MRETFFQYSCICDHLTGQQPQLLIAATIYRVGVAGLGPRPRGCYSYVLSFQVKLVLCRLKNDTFAIGSRNLSPPLKVSRRRRVNEGVSWGSISDKCPVTHPWCCRTAQKLFILEQFFKNIKTYFIFNF